jgi:hypothetical protein
MNLLAAHFINLKDKYLSEYTDKAVGWFLFPAGAGTFLFATSSTPFLTPTQLISRWV